MLFTLLICAGSLLQARDSSIHPIDARLNSCLRESHATMPRAGCYNKASQAWDEDIRKTLDALMSAAGPAKKKDLLLAQKKWESLRDAEFNKIAAKYNKRKGTGYIPVRIALRMKILRQRALELEAQSTP